VNSGRTFFSMFSYFSSIYDTTSNKFIDLQTLVGIIRNNPAADKITEIRTRRSNEDDSYRQLKEELPNITPNCMVSKRSLNEENFQTNFIQSSGYIYFDFDISNPDEYKDYFIRKYGDKASLVCLSTSKGGISVLFKVKNNISNDNFEIIRNQIIDTILLGEPIDKNAGGIGRAMFISHDPAVFINHDNIIEVLLPETIVSPNKKKVNQSNSSTIITNRLNSPFSILSIDKVYEKLHTCTQVEVLNPVVDFKPVEFVEVYIPKLIKDNTKHTIYSSMIHHLVHLNPNIEKEYIFSFLFYVNNRFARPKMERKELIRFFNLIYNGIKRTEINNHRQYTKFVHFNHNCRITKKEKIQISNSLNGYVRRNISIKKIQETTYELKHSGQKITQVRIAEISGLSPKTVRTHLNSKLIDMDEMVRLINDSIYATDSNEEADNQTRLAGNVFKRAFTSRKDNDPLCGQTQPACLKLASLNNGIEPISACHSRNKVNHYSITKLSAFNQILHC